MHGLQQSDSEQAGRRIVDFLMVISSQRGLPVKTRDTEHAVLDNRRRLSTGSRK